MRIRPLAVALALAGTAAFGQAARSPGNYQKISEVFGGWVWYINESSVRADGPRTYRLWLTGDNRGRGSVRHQMMQVKLSCDQGLHIPLHTSSFGTGGVKLSETFRGDDSSNWTRIAAGTPVAAARPWICR